MAGHGRPHPIFGRDVGPPAPKGNRRGLIHGAKVTRKSYGKEMANKEQQIFQTLAGQAPVRASDGGLPIYDVLAVSLLADDLVRYDLMKAYSYEHGMFDEHGSPLPYVDTFFKLIDRIWRGCAAIGLTPASRAKLGLALAKSATLAEALSEPDKDKRQAMLADLGEIDAEAEEVEND